MLSLVRKCELWSEIQINKPIRTILKDYKSIFLAEIFAIGNSQGKKSKGSGIDPYFCGWVKSLLQSKSHGIKSVSTSRRFPREKSIHERIIFEDCSCWFVYLDLTSIIHEMKWLKKCSKFFEAISFGFDRYLWFLKHFHN